MLRRGEGASGAEKMRLQSWMMLVVRQGVALPLIVMISLMVVDRTMVVRCSLLLSCVLCAFFVACLALHSARCDERLNY